MSNLKKPVGLVFALFVIISLSFFWDKNNPVFAELKPGSMLPEFSLEAFDGSPLSLRYEEGQIKVQMREAVKPKSLVVHFYQPDCLQCRAQIKQLREIYAAYEKHGLLVIGVAHRGDAEDSKSLAKELGITYPLLIGTGQDLTRQLGAGDALYIIDSQGSVQFTQVGYGLGDEKVWRENIEYLLQDQPVSASGVSRTPLKVGDYLPIIRLDSLMSGKPLALTGEGGQLTFVDEKGDVKHPMAAVGFFSRY